MEAYEEIKALGSEQELKNESQALQAVKMINEAWKFTEKAKGVIYSNRRIIREIMGQGAIDDANKSFEKVFDELEDIMRALKSHDEMK